MDIRDHVARKKLRMVFFNSKNDPRTEAEFFMELEPDQKVESFHVSIAGKPAEGEILDAEKARKIYETIVAQQRDPALLEYYGSRLLRVRIFPLPPNTEFEVEVNTVEILRPQEGLVRVQTLNAVPASFRKPLREMSVTATIQAEPSLLAVFSPTHEVVTERRGESEMRMTYAKKDYLPAGPFSFYYLAGDPGFGATVLAHAEPGEDGTFMLTIAPPPGDAGRLPRDIVFAVDTSGSMLEKEKIDQVRKALKRFIATLTPEDRFNIVSFSTEAARWRETLVPATAEFREAGIAACDGLRAKGGTDMESALRLALGHEFRPGATRIVVFLTDGVPTIGERETKKLLAIASGKGVRIFSFGVGFDLNTQLLDRLAIENGGDRQYIHPDEDASAVLESFARRIDAPVLADPELEFRGGGIAEIYPRKASDVFRGGLLVVTGRFHGDAPRTLVLSGISGGKRVSHEYPVVFAPESRNAFVARLWAIQKVDFLLDEIRARGADRELVDEIVALSKRYGIVTPYTAALITEDSSANATTYLENRLKASQTANYNGADEWANARNQQEWRGARSQEAQLAAANGALGRKNDVAELERTLAQQRNVGTRAFYNRAGNWSESGYEAQAARVVKFGTDDYFGFLNENPDAGAVLALGRNVTFRHNSEWIRIE
ncbi:MAG: VWA domain-containing protein [Planctomycetes bacterium]|nr:VWA domain-containing protein [Planctomycetota bacterium]